MHLYSLGIARPTERIAIFGGKIPRTPLLIKYTQSILYHPRNKGQGPSSALPANPKVRPDLPFLFLFYPSLSLACATLRARDAAVRQGMNRHKGGSECGGGRV